MASTHTCPPTLSASNAPSRQKGRQILKEQQIENKSIISKIQNSANQNQELQPSDFQVGVCSTDHSYAAQNNVSPNYEKPETSLTVKEAEYVLDSNSE